MEGIALILGKMNVLDTSEINVLRARKINTPSLLYVPSKYTLYVQLNTPIEETHLKLFLMTLALV